MKKVFELVSWGWKFIQSFPLLSLFTLLLGTITYSIEEPKNFALVLLLVVGSILVWGGVTLGRPSESTGGSGSEIGSATFQFVGVAIIWIGTVTLLNAMVLGLRIFL